MRARLGIVATASLLAGCATTLESTLAPAAPPGIVAVGAPAAVWPAERADAELAAFRAELERRVASGTLTVPAQLSQAADGTLRVRLGIDESFAPDSAQLLAPALSAYAELAAAVCARPGVVTHVLVHGDASGVDPATDITLRRAASIVSYLASRGVPEARLRGEGRGTAEPLTLERADLGVNRRVELVFKPVIAGREAAAWVPPEPLPPCEPCGGG